MATVSTAYPAQLAGRTAQRNPVKYITGSAADNDGGIMIAGGTIASGVMSNRTVTQMARNNKATGTQPVATAEGGSVKAKSDRTFAYDSSTPWIIARYTTTLGGVASTAFTTSSSKVRNKLNFSVKDYATLDVTRGWDYVSGQHPTLPAASTVSYTQIDGVTTTSVDRVTQETPEIPGQLTYRTGKANPVTSNYAARSVN